MFQDLDNTLKNVLNDPAMDPPLTELLAADKSFVTPDKNFTPAQPTVDLFLYDVKENRELRDPVPIVEKIGNTFVRRQPPLRMDCSYIVTAWSNQVIDAKVVEEHRLLSQAVQWLSRFSTIPEKHLPADWKDKTKPTYQPFPPPTWIAQMDPNKNAGEFWVALGVPPRSAFYLTVTIAMEFGVQVPEGPPVVTKDMRLFDKDRPAAQERWFQIGGKVFEAANPDNLINGAQVRLVEKDETALTNEQGQFTFTLLLAGNYTLGVSKTGFTNQTKNIVVPATSLNAYDVGMAP
jgi:hypothetical protein